MEQLGINAGYLLIQIVGFVLLMLLLRTLLYTPMLNALESRREKIAEGVNNARKAEEALASAGTDKQKIIDQARADAQQILSEARGRADETTRRLIAEAEQDAQRIRAQAQEDADSERDRVLSEMRDQIVSISMAAANRLIGASLDEKQQHRLVEDFFTAIPEGAGELGDSFVVITAVPLTEAEIRRFKKELGSEDVTFMTDPGILGGVIVRAGGQQLDGSFASQLASMKTSLL